MLRTKTAGHGTLEILAAKETVPRTRPPGPFVSGYELWAAAGFEYWARVDG